MNPGQPEYSTLFVSGNNHSILSGSSLVDKKSGAWAALLFKLFIILASVTTSLVLAGCAAPLVALGGATTSAASTAGSAAVSVAVANPSTAASAISTVTTGKSPLEHAASAATKQDCNFLNALGSKPICVDIPIPTITDKSEPYLGPADAPSPNTKQ
jgi:hypothetical protein